MIQGEGVEVLVCMAVPESQVKDALNSSSV
jgi:hypothetical protein